MANRTRQIIFRLTDDENAQLKQLVRKSGLTQAGYIRMLIAGFIPREKPPPDYYAMMNELRHVGNNLNQIARAIHSTGVFNPAEYDENVKLYRDILRKITKSVIEPEKAKR